MMHSGDLPRLQGSGYYQELPRLKSLQKKAFAEDPSAVDLIDQLDDEARAAGFDPIGANSQGVTPDSFFSANPHFLQLEDKLSQRIIPENVSEVIRLVGQADFYTPTRKVTAALIRSCISQLTRQTGIEGAGEFMPNMQELGQQSG